MTQQEIIEFVTALPDVTAVTASQATGAPEPAWGDTFFTHTPDHGRRAAPRMPFATLVTHDYAGFATAPRPDAPTAPFDTRHSHHDDQRGSGGRQPNGQPAHPRER